MASRYPVRIQLFVTESMDDQLDDMADVMQITKPELIRYILGQALIGQKAVIDAVKEKVDRDV